MCLPMAGWVDILETQGVCPARLSLSQELHGNKRGREAQVLGEGPLPSVPRGRMSPGGRTCPSRPPSHPVLSDTGHPWVLGCVLRCVPSLPRFSHLCNGSHTDSPAPSGPIRLASHSRPGADPRAPCARLSGAGGGGERLLACDFLFIH